MESLREQLNDLEAEYVRLGKAKEISADTKALIASLLVLLKLLCSIFLEKSTKKNSRNSSISSSQSDPDDTSKPKRYSQKTKSRSDGSGVEQCDNTRTRETIEILQVNDCGVCGEDL
jgi:hypothetical protein